MSNLGAAMASGLTLVPVYTGNNIGVAINGQTVGLAQTVTVVRAIGRQPVYQVGTPLFADAPVRTVLATLTISGMVAQAATGNAWMPQIMPSGSLSTTVSQAAVPSITLTDAGGTVVCTITNSFFNGDTWSLAANDPMTLNATILAQDASNSGAIAG